VALVPLLGFDRVGATLAFGVCAFVLGAIALEFVRGVRVRARGEASWASALVSLVTTNRRRYGGYIVHLGITTLALGIIGSSFFQETADVRLRPGESHQAGPYTISYKGLSSYQGSGYKATAATLAVGGPSSLQLQPERRLYPNWEQQPVTGVAIGTTLPWLDDVYVLLTEWDDAHVANFRIFINPLVSLIWLGGALLLAGTLVAAWPSAVAARQRMRVVAPPPKGVLVDA
jgi:cytochrome c-type biogenesis protein CcmF